MSIWGASYLSWDLNFLRDLRALIPRIQIVLPIIGEHAGIIARLEGGLEGVPEMVRMEVRGKMTSVFLCPERPDELLELAGVADLLRISGDQGVVAEVARTSEKQPFLARCVRGEAAPSLDIIPVSEKSEQEEDFVDMGACFDERAQAEHVIIGESRGAGGTYPVHRASRSFNVQPAAKSGCPNHSGQMESNYGSGFDQVGQGAGKQRCYTDTLYRDSRILNAQPAAESSCPNHSGQLEGNFESGFDQVGQGAEKQLCCTDPLHRDSRILKAQTAAESNCPNHSSQLEGNFGSGLDQVGQGAGEQICRMGINDPSRTGECTCRKGSGLGVDSGLQVGTGGAGQNETSSRIHSGQVLCSLLETPNRFRWLAGGDPIQNVPAQVSVADSELEQGIVAANLIGSKARVATKGNLECPSVQRAIERIISDCRPAADSIVDEGIVEIEDCEDSEQINCVGKVVLQESNWDRLGQPVEQGLMDSLVVMDSECVELAVQLLDAKMVDEGTASVGETQSPASVTPKSGSADLMCTLTRFRTDNTLLMSSAQICPPCPGSQDMVCSGRERDSGTLGNLRKLKLDEYVANVWPGFETEGKDLIKVHHVLNHTSGLHNAMSDAFLNPLLMSNWKDCLHDIVASTPETKAGHEQLYHYSSFGWLCGGIIEHASGKKFQEVLDEAIVLPLNLEGELFIGIPPGVESRLASVTPDMEDLKRMLQQGRGSVDLPSTFQAAHIYNNGVVYADIFNSPQTRQSIVPSGNGYFSARALARYYATLASGGTVPPPATASNKVAVLKETSMSEHCRGKKIFQNPKIHDAFLGVGDYADLALPNKPYGLGFVRYMSEDGLSSFGHAGFGGSIGFCDIKHNFAMAVTVNQMTLGAVTEHIVKLVCSEVNVPVPQI